MPLLTGTDPSNEVCQFFAEYSLLSRLRAIAPRRVKWLCDQLPPKRLRAKRRTCVHREVNHSGSYFLSNWLMCALNINCHQLRAEALTITATSEYMILIMDALYIVGFSKALSIKI